MIHKLSIFFYISFIFINLVKAESAQVAKPSFDCAKATTKVEKMICNDESGELQNLDRYMSEVYTQLRNELRKSSLSDKNQRLDNLLQTQRKFIKSANKINSNNLSSIYEDLFGEYDEELIQRIKDNEKMFTRVVNERSIIRLIYEKRITALLKLLGEVLDSNNKELCEYARKGDMDLSEWREIKYSANDPLYTLGFCLGSDYNYKYCTYGKLTEKQKFINDKDRYAELQIYVKELDINNDGKKETIMLLQGDSSQTLYVLTGNQLNEKASDRIYGDDLHFSEAYTFGNLWKTMEVGERISFVLTTYALPRNKITRRFDFKMFEEREIYSFESEEDIKRGEQENILPQFTVLFYSIMEFKEKNYIRLISNRFFWDESEKYPNVRIYLLEGNKRELKCTFFKKVNENSKL
ncbi:hypothetical protein OQH60_06050 [Campylobacter sp. MIT 21-1685]|uniref:lysozyme inhibitor LprI family protein n=1 Tax=unclassified Campylobacter TaxID=2593542 RepID=UPI00224AF535|nr:MULTISPECIES: hypothetical protein [unclassified Campylobacter]MCX2683367.1 hypothetical protein [Campylobacter sp. MIT 21-1684]MCX2751706.1 hypothetical protein [Campylobacter sp. MIT 21-1682]MCX2807908.1 hypothetical protein [Campylobacter sp. MIT 21-1685]